MQLPVYTKEEFAPAAPIKCTQKEGVLPAKYVKMLQKTRGVPQWKAVGKCFLLFLIARCSFQKELLSRRVKAKVLFFLIGCFFFKKKRTLKLAMD